MNETTKSELSVETCDPILILHHAAGHLRVQGKTANENDDVYLLQHNAAQILRER